jgi:prevent-host-death family protein
VREIQLREAKAFLSAIVEAAIQGEAALIRRLGKPAAAFMGYREWRRLSQTRACSHPRRSNQAICPNGTGRRCATSRPDGYLLDASGFVNIAIAATGVHHQLTISTQLFQHFESPGAAVIDLSGRSSIKSKFPSPVASDKLT